MPPILKSLPSLAWLCIHRLIRQFSNAQINKLDSKLFCRPYDDASIFFTSKTFANKSNKNVSFHNCRDNCSFWVKEQKLFKKFLMHS